MLPALRQSRNGTRGTAARLILSAGGWSMTRTRIAGRLGAVDGILPADRPKSRPARRLTLLPFAPSSIRRRTIAMGMAAVLTLGAGFSLAPQFRVLAFENAGVMSFLLAEGERKRQRQAVNAYRAHYRSTVDTPPAYRALSIPVPVSATRPPRKKTAHAPARQPHRAARTATLGRRAICVRTCDGFHFPMGSAAGKRDLAAQEALCGALCPGAPTQLFLAGRGQTDIDTAIARDGSRYAALPAAFRYTRRVDSTCSCRPDGQSQARLISLHNDFTMRRGDSVMTDAGFRVFRGASRWPLRGSDFVTLAKAPVNRSLRRKLARMEAATRAAPRLAGQPSIVLPPARPARHALPRTERPGRQARAAFEERTVMQ